MSGRSDESRDGVPLTNLDQPLFEGAQASKRDLVDYLDAVRDRILPELDDRPLSVIRVHRDHEAFMQKNLPKYAPAWIPRIRLWAESSKRDVDYALCGDRRTLLWFANQRAVEYHPTLLRASRPDHMTHLVLDLDPPEHGGFKLAVRAAHAVRLALSEAGLEGAVKTSGAKGVHVIVPHRRPGQHRGRGRRDTGSRGAGRTAGARHLHDRLHQGRPRRQGVPRRHPRRRGDRGGRVQPSRARLVCRCRSPSHGTISTACHRPTSRCTARSGTSETAIHGPPSSLALSPCPPSWSRRATPSRSAGCRPCTRANGVPAPAAATKGADQGPERH